MRAGAAGLLAAALSVLPGAVLAEPEIDASFEDPVTAAAYAGDWPIWSRMVVKTTRRGGTEVAIVRGWLSTTWYIDPDEDGFFLGNRPEVVDVNGDGRAELVAIQYLPSSGWRLAAFNPPSDGLDILGEAAFSAGVEQAVLLGVLDAADDDGALIGVVLREGREGRLLIYSFHDGKPVTQGPYEGYGAGPAGAAPRIRLCGDQRVFLVANIEDGTVTAIGRRGESDELRVWTSTVPATDEGFAEAASCG